MNYENPTVSVIMPAYNAQTFLDEAILSVQQQTMPNWQLIIINDASTDNTLKIAQHYADIDPRITIINRTENSKNANLARQNGLDYASGRYIAYLDADDMWLDAKLEKQLAFMQKHDSAISCHTYRRITPEGEITGRAIKAPVSVITQDIYLKNTCIGHLTSMVDRQKTGNFVIRTDDHSEFKTWLTLLREHDAHFMDEDLARYRRGQTSLSSNKIRMGFRQAARYYEIRNDVGHVRAATGFVGYAYNALKKHARF